MTKRARVFAVCAVFAAAGCGAEPATAPRLLQPTSSASGAAASAGLGSGRWGQFRSKRFDLTLPLPDGKAWRIDDRSGPWLVASHAGAASSIHVRTWQEDEVQNRARCEARARSWLDLPAAASLEVVRDEPVPVPPGFDTRVNVALVSPRPGAPLEGVALAFGGWAHKCFAFVYRTTAAGPGAEAAIGERLAVVVDGGLGQIEMGSDLRPEIPREPR